MSRLLAVTTLSLCSLGLAAHAEIGTVANPQTLNQFLARDYYNQALLERDPSRLDIKDEAIMMDRSVSALRGYQVPPVPLNGIAYVGATRQEMTDARKRMVRVLKNRNTVSSRPELVSRAQVAYDCWAMQQQAGPNASHNLTNCRERFMRTIAMLDTGEPERVVTKPVKWRVVKTYNIYFDWDKSNIREDAKSTLDEIRAELNKPENQTKRIAVGGFADRSGPPDYNQQLSAERVKSVARYLNVTPVSADDVDLRAFGERNLPVQTADGVRLQANRVAHIAIVEEETGEVVVKQPQR